MRIHSNLKMVVIQDENQKNRIHYLLPIGSTNILLPAAMSDASYVLGISPGHAYFNLWLNLSPSAINAPPKIKTVSGTSQSHSDGDAKILTFNRNLSTWPAPSLGCFMLKKDEMPIVPRPSSSSALFWDLSPC